jgi:hypothetical protein
MTDNIGLQLFSEIMSGIRDSDENLPEGADGTKDCHHVYLTQPTVNNSGGSRLLNTAEQAIIFLAAMPPIADKPGVAWVVKSIIININSVVNMTQLCIIRSIQHPGFSRKIKKCPINLVS